MNDISKENIEIAPLSDVACTTVYKGLSESFGIAIGSAITMDEIEMMFKEAVNDGKTDVHQALKKIMEEVDLNIDGKISFEEFAIFMKQLIK